MNSSTSLSPTRDKQVPGKAKVFWSCASLPKVNLDQPHRSVTMHLDNLKPLIRFLQQSLKLLLSPLLRIQNYHHPNVQLTQPPLLKPRLLTQCGQYGIIDEQRGSWLALLQRRHEPAQYLDAFLIGPVVHALADEEGAGVEDRLGVEEIVLHVGDTRLDFGRQKGLALGDHLVRAVLDDKGELGELLFRDHVRREPGEHLNSASSMAKE